MSTLSISLFYLSVCPSHLTLEVFITVLHHHTCQIDIKSIWFQGSSLVVAYMLLCLYRVFTQHAEAGLHFLHLSIDSLRHNSVSTFLELQAVWNIGIADEQTILYGASPHRHRNDSKVEWHSLWDLSVVLDPRRYLAVSRRRRSLMKT